ncbi:MAG: ABC transporter permease [Planctomycetota bacterium]
MTDSTTPTGTSPWQSVIRALGPFLALAIVIVFFGLADRYFNGADARFLSLHNARTVCTQTAVVGVAALGMTVIIIAGGIDLSIGTAIALSATVLAWMLTRGYPANVAVLGCLLTGCATGFLNGWLISALRVVPFIVTLGTMTLFVGLAKMLANDTTIRPKTEVVPAWLSSLLTTSGNALYLGVPLGLVLALVLALILAIILQFTVFGRHVYALGSNEATARLCGINVFANRLAVYTLAGLFAGMAGVYQFARLSVGEPTAGGGLELKIIAAVVIGGGSLSGGRGTVSGTLAGAIMINVINSGCTQLGLGNSLWDIMLGVTIIAAVTFDQWRQS